MTAALGISPSPEGAAVLRKVLEHSLSEDARAAVQSQRPVLPVRRVP